MAMRIASVATIAAVLFGAVSAAAAMDRPDAVAYPVETGTPAAKPAKKPAARQTIKPAAKTPAVKHAAPAAATKQTPPAAAVKQAAPAAAAKPSAIAVVLPPAKPAALSAAKPAAPELASVNPTATADVFAGIAQDERLKIQAALLWSGDYTGAANGEDPMLAAIKNFQKRSKAKVTGQLTPSERTTLLAAARDHEKEFGWSVVADPATGIRIGLPTKMVPHAREAARGTRWSSGHDEIQVETFRIADPNLKLSALFEQEKKEPSTRKVEYSVLRDDSFYISGLQGLRKFSVRAQMRNGEVRGFTMLFDQAMEGIVAPVAVAMASAFSPFPQRGAPFATLSKSVEYGNGLVVSAQGHIVTDARLVQGCQVLVAAGLGDADRVAEDNDNGLALLRVYGPRKLVPVSLAREVGSAKEKTNELTLVGVPDPQERDGKGKLSEIKARLADGNAIELRQPVPMAGFTGAAALDAQGRFVGMTEMRNAVLASMQGSAPPVRLVRAETIRKFLDAHHVAVVDTQTADAKQSVVRIICVRK